MRGWRAGMVAVVVLASLCACSAVRDAERVVGSVGRQAAMEGALARMSAELYALDTVESVTTSASIASDFSFDVTAEVMLSGSAIDAAAEVATILQTDLSTTEFDRQRVWVDVEGGGVSLFSSSAFPISREVIDRERAYWLALADAMRAPLWMDLEPYESDAGVEYFRTFGIATPDATADIPWDALRAVPVPSGASSSWLLGPLDAVTSLPPAAVTDFVMAQLADLSSSITAAPMFSWSPDAFRIALFVEPPAGSLEAGVDWPRVSAMVAAASGIGIPTTISVTWEGLSRPLSIHLGECVGVQGTEPGDEKFLAALAASGIVLPDGSYGGYCGPV